MAHPLDGIDVLLIDGNNLLHRVAGSADPTALRTLIPRLRSAIPTTIATVLMLDGHAGTGANRHERAGKSFDIRHSGSTSADDALVRLIFDQPHAERANTTIVTDDITLANRARQLGARTNRLNWLEALLESSVGNRTGIGGGGQQAPARNDDGGEREPWKPGRGATRKIGNPRRGRSGPRRATGRR